MPLLEPQEVTDFLDATTGSIIEVRGPQFPRATNVRVLQLQKEFGATHIPALFVRDEDTGAETVISSNGQHTIRIIRGTKDLVGKYTPDTAVIADLIPEEVQAVQFQGGAEQAVELVKWTVGKATVVYIEGNINQPERVDIITMNDTTPLSIGDWLVYHPFTGQFEPMSSDTYSSRYVSDPDPRRTLKAADE